MNIRNRQQFLMILAASAAVLYAGDLLVVGPLGTWWTARAQRIATLRKQVQEGTALVRREAGIRGRWNSMRTNTLPADASLAEQQVLNAFTSWSRGSGAEVTDTIPQWKNDSDEYSTLTCRLEAAGTLATLGDFLYRIEGSPMALRLNSVQLGTRDKTGQRLTLGLQVSGLTLNAEPKP
jgi:hypothetical protein